MNKLIIFIIIIFKLYNYANANPNIQARTAILFDYHSDEILFELDPIKSSHTNDQNYDGNCSF